jgi:excisionase family DNA binding protein
MSKDSRHRRDGHPAAINAAMSEGAPAKGAPPKDAPPRIRHSLPEAAYLLGISLSLLYQRIEQGHLRPVHDGRRTLVTDAEIRRYAEVSRP